MNHFKNKKFFMIRNLLFKLSNYSMLYYVTKNNISILY